MRMPAVVIRNHRDRHIAELGLASQLGFLQVGHADHVHAQAAVNVGLGLGGKLRAFHAKVGSTLFADYANLLAGGFHDAREFSADGICKSDVGCDSVAEKCIDAMPSKSTR